MDKETSRLQTGRSSPKTGVLEQRSFIASIPRTLPESLGGPSTPRSFPLYPFESIDNQRTADSNYEVAHSPRSLSYVTYPVGARHEPRDGDAVCHYSRRALQDNSEKELRAATESPSDLHTGDGSGTSHPSHSDSDAIVNPEEYDAITSPVNLTASPPSITRFSRRPNDVPGPLTLSCRWGKDQRPTVVDPRIASVAVSPNSSRDLSGIPREGVGSPTIRSIKSSHSPSLQSEKPALSSELTVNTTQAPRFTLPQRSAKSASTPKELQSCELLMASGSSYEETSKAYSGLDCPVTRPGLHRRELSSISSTSTDLTEATDSEDISPESEPGPASLAMDPLIRHLITFLIARWLGTSLTSDLNNPAENFRKCPQGPSTGQAGGSAVKRPLKDSPYQSDHQSRGGESGDGSDLEDDGESRQRRRKNQKVDNSASGTPQLLACPFHKMNPLRYSGLNEVEKEYRNCSSGYWPDISRLKQHLRRTHLRPDFYCRRCYATFEKESDFDDHCRQETPCERQLERKFQEKINDEQMAEIKKKRPGASPVDCWQAIFKILFPHVDMPDSPYIGTSEHEMQRNLYDYFCREAPPVLSSLLQNHLQPLSALDPGSLNRICQETANLVIQLVAPRSGAVPPCQLQANTISNPHVEEAGPSNTYPLANYGSNPSQPPSDMNGYIHHSHTNQGDPSISELFGNIGSDNCYSNMGSISPDFHQPLYTTQPDLEQIYGFVSQHTRPDRLYSWDRGPSRMPLD